MWALRNLKRFFPIAREILLPVSGAAWTWFFAVAVLRLEPFVVLNRIAVVCMFIGSIAVALESTFLKPAAVPGQITWCVYTVVEPVAYMFFVLLGCSFLGFLEIPGTVNDVLIQFGTVGMINILFIVQQVAFGLFMGCMQRDNL